MPARCLATCTMQSAKKNGRSIVSCCLVPDITQNLLTNGIVTIAGIWKTVARVGYNRTKIRDRYWASSQHYPLATQNCRMSTRVGNSG